MCAPRFLVPAWASAFFLCVVHLPMVFAALTPGQEPVYDQTHFVRNSGTSLQFWNPVRYNWASYGDITINWKIPGRSSSTKATRASGPGFHAEERRAQAWLSTLEIALNVRLNERHFLEVYKTRQVAHGPAVDAEFAWWQTEIMKQLQSDYQYGDAWRVSLGLGGWGEF